MDRYNTPLCKIIVYAVHDCKNERELFEKTKGLEKWLDNEFGDKWTGQIDAFYFSGCYKSIGHDDFYDAFEKDRGRFKYTGNKKENDDENK